MFNKHVSTYFWSVYLSLSYQWYQVYMLIHVGFSRPDEVHCQDSIDTPYTSDAKDSPGAAPTDAPGAAPTYTPGAAPTDALGAAPTDATGKIPDQSPHQTFEVSS